MRLHRVLADVQPLGDLSIAEPCRERLQDLELARRDAELRDAGLVARERSRGRHRYLAHDDRLARLLQLQTEPDAQRREKRGDDATVDLERMLDDQKAIL